MAPRFVFPTGSRLTFVGSGAFGFGLDASVAREFERVRLGGHVGFEVHTSGDSLHGIRPDDELRWGIAVGFPLADRQVEPQIEFVGGTVIDPNAHGELGIGPFNPRNTPAELHFGVRFDPKNAPIFFKIGGGPGIGPGFGTPDVRVYAMVGPQFPLKKQAPEPEPIAEPIADPDPDGDGILGDADECPDEPEDKDEFADDDGCPDPDNDSDGVLDVDDGAPLDPEDKDGFEDEDGVPDWDNDGDGLTDGVDSCPNRPEVINGFEDEDGCPDEALVEVKDNEIVILERVLFATNSARILDGSTPLLTDVANVLRGYPEIRSLQIEGHTDERGSEIYNRDLSQRRAESVMHWLVDAGVEPERLVAVGFGESKPVVAGASTDEDHAKNRRVQFLIVEKASGAEVETR